MNKYNIGDTVYYLDGRKGIKSGKVAGMKEEYDTINYWIGGNNEETIIEDELYSTVDELIEWLKTTVK